MWGMRPGPAELAKKEGASRAIVRNQITETRISMAKKNDKKKKGKKDSTKMKEPTPLVGSEVTKDSGRKMKRKEFDREMKRLHVELVRLQEWVRASGAKICVLFEGRDAAGKGGVIKRITERTSPRVFRVVALSAPTDREKSQMYFQRYIPHLPAAGEVVLFDRSWYNRAGVERVMGFADPEEVERFLRVTPMVEQAIIDSGVILVKYWLEVSMENQTRRFEERITDERKIWKLSPMDLESHRRWYDYSRARDAMFAATDSDASPWYVVDANDQRRGRLNCIAHFLSLVPYQEVPRATIALPARQAAEGYTEPDHPFRYVPERY
jgi:polyphosphate kinase 2